MKISSRLLDFSAITLSNVLIRTVLSKKGNHFTWPVYFLILKELKCWIRMVFDCSCLASTQEEADTPIILHALYSDKLYQENNVQDRIVVKSPDTDVLVLLVHYFPNMKNTVSFGFKQDLLRTLRIVDVISLRQPDPSNYLTHWDNRTPPTT